MGRKAWGDWEAAWVTTIVSARRFRSDAYGVKVDLDAAGLGRTHGDHAEEAMARSAKECDAFVEHTQVLELFCHVREYRKQFTWG